MIMRNKFALGKKNWLSRLEHCWMKMKLWKRITIGCDIHPKSSIAKKNIGKALTFTKYQAWVNKIH